MRNYSYYSRVRKLAFSTTRAVNMTWDLRIVITKIQQELLWIVQILTPIIDSETETQLSLSESILVLKFVRSRVIPAVLKH